MNCVVYLGLIKTFSLQLKFQSYSLNIAIKIKNELINA